MLVETTDVEVTESELLTGQDKTAIKDFIGAWLKAHIKEILGPLADQAQEEVSKGDVGAALGDTAGLVVANRGARALPEIAAAVADWVLDQEGS